MKQQYDIKTPLISEALLYENQKHYELTTRHIELYTIIFVNKHYFQICYKFMVFYFKCDCDHLRCDQKCEVVDNTFDEKSATANTPKQFSVSNIDWYS